MSVVDDLNTLFQELGNELSALGRDLSVIAEEALAEIWNDPMSYIRDSARELTGMGICHPLLSNADSQSKRNVARKRWES